MSVTLEGRRLRAEFWAAIDADSNKERVECLEWPGHRSSLGYGLVGGGGNQEFVHRRVWAHVNGPIPDGLCVLHKCDNPPCSWPTHLFLGTKADNTRDMIAKGRARFHTSKPTPVDIAALADAYQAGATFTELSTQFRTRRQRVRQLLVEAGVQLRPHGSRRRLPECSRGHEFTPENTVVARNGDHSCRKCRRMRDRKEWLLRDGAPLNNDGSITEAPEEEDAA